MCAIKTQGKYPKCPYVCQFRGKKLSAQKKIRQKEKAKKMQEREREAENKFANH